MRPTLFEVFGIPVRSYGVMMVIGFALGLWRAARVSSARYQIPPERVYDIAIVALLSGVIGARALFVLLNPETERWAEFFAVWQGGLSFHGGFAAAMAAGWVYTRFARLRFWDCADLVAPSAALGYAMARIGCFLNGCCYGAPTSLPWAVRFGESEPLTPPSHPTQIYACVANLIIFIILIRAERARLAPGFVFAAYVGLYGVYRFLIEFLRAGYTAQVWGFGLTQAQVVSALMIAASGVAMAALRRKTLRNRRASRPGNQDHE